MKYNKNMDLSLYKRPIIGSLILALIGITYSVVSDRILYADAGLFLYDLLTSHASPIPYPQIRYTGPIFQYPTILLAKFGMNDAAKFVYSTVYHLIPVLLLLVIICKKMTEISIIIAFFFWLVLFPSLPFPVNYATESSTMGWGIFLLLLNDKLTKKSFIFIVGLLVLMNISYETAIILYFPLILLTWLKRKSYQSFNYKYLLLVLIIAFLIKFGLNLKTSILLMGTPVILNFKNAFLDAYPITKTPFMYAFASLMLFSFINKKVVRYIFLILSVFSFLYFSMITDVNQLIFTSHSFRSFIVPLTFFGMLISIIHLHTRFKIKTDNVLMIIFCITVIISLVRDMRTTAHWAKGVTKFNHIIKSSKGCTTLDEDTAFNDLYQYGFMDESITKTSILLQTGGKIDTIILPGTRNYDFLKGVDFCENYHETDNYYVVQYRGGYFPDNIRLDNFLVQKNISFKPSRKIFKFSELNNCESVSILNFDRDEINIKNDIGDGNYKIKLFSNENPKITTSATIIIVGQDNQSIILNHQDTDISFNIKNNENLKIIKNSTRHFKDKYHPNAHFIAAKCITTNGSK